MYKYLVLISLWAPCFLFEENETTQTMDARKIYGLSFKDEKCHDFVRTFKCMTACKSKGFQIYRLNYLCKCTCHDVSSSTILPYFKWRTTRPTRTIPKTQSVSLYHIIGTLSPRPTKPKTTPVPTTVFTCPPAVTESGRFGPEDDSSGSGSGDENSDSSTMSLNDVSETSTVTSDRADKQTENTPQDSPAKENGSEEKYSTTETP